MKNPDLLVLNQPVFNLSVHLRSFCYAADGFDNRIGLSSRAIHGPISHQPSTFSELRSTLIGTQLYLLYDVLESPGVPGAC